MLFSAGRSVNTYLLWFDELAPKATNTSFAELMLGLDHVKKRTLGKDFYRHM